MLDSNILQCQDVKRKYAFEELVQTEKNYLCCLKHLLKIQNCATFELWPGSALLSKTEAKIIFANLEQILAIHHNTAGQFEDILINWKTDAPIGQVFIRVKDTLMKQYVAYSNSYKESIKMFKLCQKTNQRFQVFLKDTMKSFKVGDPKDLFIRPIQRLCSVTLLLQEIKKNTRDDNPDKNDLNEAIKVIKDVLHMMDKDQERVDKLINIFEIHRLVEGSPPDLITSHREFIVHFTAQEVINKQNCLGIHVSLFLFSDILQIAKVRSRAQEILKNRTSFSSLKEKPYKHIAMLPLSMILHVIKFKGNSENDKNIFGFNIRDLSQEKKTTLHCFQYSQDNSQKLDDILKVIANQLSQRDSTKSENNYILDSVPTRRLSIDPISCNSQSIVSSALDKVSNILKKTPKHSKKALRKSVSCGDLQDISTVL